MDVTLSSPTSHSFLPPYSLQTVLSPPVDEEAFISLSLFRSFDLSVFALLLYSHRVLVVASTLHLLSSQASDFAILANELRRVLTTSPCSSMFLHHQVVLHI